ncbi:MAG: glyoxalase/bleomycin resistance/dioxygenase family protein, partial [Pseudomonadota bacterium]|nr:glyoxalase/bleomycin resistance/dioxygenase family protein [Pseudomonadota bacterium]
NHLGFQVDSDAELESMHGQLVAADSAVLAQKNASCCYARSDKYWVTDPAGVAWETFYTLGSVPVYGSEAAQTKETNAACCGSAAMESKSACCA